MGMVLSACVFMVLLLCVYGIETAGGGRLPEHLCFSPSPTRSCKVDPTIIQNDVAALTSASTTLTQDKSGLATAQAQVVQSQQVVSNSQSAFDAAYQQLINDLAAQFGTPPPPAGSASADGGTPPVATQQTVVSAGPQKVIHIHT
jgi:hypothetical protein